VHNLKRITSPHGHWILFNYDHNNRVAKTLDDRGASIGYSYDTAGRLVEVTKNGDLVWRYSYDETGMTRVERSRKQDVVVIAYARGQIATLTSRKKSYLPI
jgi:YD repeat-containing protein